MGRIVAKGLIYRPLIGFYFEVMWKGISERRRNGGRQDNWNVWSSLYLCIEHVIRIFIVIRNNSSCSSAFPVIRFFDGKGAEKYNLACLRNFILCLCSVYVAFWCGVPVMGITMWRNIIITEEEEEDVEWFSYRRDAMESGERNNE